MAAVAAVAVAAVAVAHRVLAGLVAGVMERFKLVRQQQELQIAVGVVVLMVRQVRQTLRAVQA